MCIVVEYYSKVSCARDLLFVRLKNIVISNSCWKDTHKFGQQSKMKRRLYRYFNSI
jgi:uncharacterized membrane protein YjgN (DUF898 family)